MHNDFYTALDIFIVVHLNNIPILSKNEEDHLKHLHSILENLSTHNFKAKYKKSGFALASVEYLDHTIQTGIFISNPLIICNILDKPIPIDIK